jgi:hypothetical protein
VLTQRRVELPCAVQFDDGTFIIARAVGGNARKEVGARVVGLLDHDLIQNRLRLVDTTDLEQCRRAVQAYLDIAGLEFERAVEMRDSTCKVTLLLSDHSEVLDGGRIFGIRRDHLLELRRSGVVIFVAEGDHSAVESQLGRNRGERGGGR